MSIQFSFGNGLLRTAVSLGFFVFLVAQGTLASRAAPIDPGFCASPFASLNTADIPARSAVVAGSPHCDGLCLDWSDFVLTDQVEICLTDDYIALEDSVEMLRVGQHSSARSASIK